MKYSLAQQWQAIEHCLAMLQTYDRIAPEILAPASAGVDSLKFFGKRQHLARAMAELDKEAPGAAAIAETWPEAKVEIIGSGRAAIDAVINRIVEGEVEIEKL